MTPAHKAASSSEELGATSCASGWTGRYLCCSFLMGNCAGVQGNAEINPSFSAPHSSGMLFFVMILGLLVASPITVSGSLCALLLGSALALFFFRIKECAFLDFSFLGVALLPIGMKRPT